MMTPVAIEPTITVRRLKLGLVDGLPVHWHGGDPFLSHFFDGLSVLFPVGEQFFIDTVREWQAEIGDEGLRSQIRGFIGQEGVHRQAHLQYNDILRKRGYDIDRFERKLNRRVRFVQRFLPAKDRLASVLAYEHFTAILADAVLRDHSWLHDAHPVFAQLWLWHAVEETEHKAVAFEIYCAVGGGYFRRILQMLVVTFLFVKDVISHQFHMIHRDGQAFDLRLWWRGFKYAWISPGIFLPVTPAYFRYFSPRFHPWKTDNTDLVMAWRQEHEQTTDRGGRE